jgi:MFS transporter, SP family, solute carrier family 2 (myo-inositol transporter), member 13
VTSLTSGGALVGAVAAGLTADRFGRKMPIWAACIVFCIGTLLQAVAWHVPQFAVGRFVVGLGVGSAACIVPLYISEIAPAKYRGRMVAFNNMSVTFGQLIASALGAGFTHVEGEGWRATVSIGAAPAMVLAGLLLMCPESPRQLAAHGNLEQADQVLQRIYPESTAEQRQAKLKAIEMSIQEATATMVDDSLWKTLKRIFTTPATGRAVLTACVIMAISQLGGFNSLMVSHFLTFYFLFSSQFASKFSQNCCLLTSTRRLSLTEVLQYYSATLFKIVGFSNATAVAIVVSGTNFIFSWVNLLLVDRFGRRAILKVTVLGMAICMLLAAVSFHYIPVTRDLVVESSNIGWPGVLVLICIICYVAFFSSGVATIGWIGVELIPMEVRAVGTMLNTVTCWSTNIIIASTFLSMMKGLTPSGAFGFYCGICTVGWLFIMFFYPECKGMPLEAIREVFAHGFGVKYSKQWQKDNKHLARTATVQSFGH